MILNAPSTIVISAQFGGRDAAALVLSHFKALKAASADIGIESFPYPQLGFILRVDGDVNQYGNSGVGNLDIDEDGKYLSVDIGVTKDDRVDIASCISSAILNSLPIISDAINKQGHSEFDAAKLLSGPLKLLCERYEQSQVQ